MNTFKREPIEGGDENTWADLLLTIISDAIGSYTCSLYNDTGSLKLRPGQIGIDDNTNRGVSEIDTETTIDISGLISGNWGKVEMSVSGSSVSFVATDISGASDPAVLPIEFTSAYLDVKSGFYVNPTLRTIGIVWKDSGGDLQGVVNCADKINGYIGNNVTDDVNEDPIYFEKNIVQKDNKKFNNVQKFSIAYATTGKTFSTSGWEQLPIDGLSLNEIDGLSLVTNRLTIPPGRYRFNGYLGGLAFDIQSADLESRFQDVTNNVTIVKGGSTAKNFGDNNQGPFSLYIDGIFSLDSTIEAQMEMSANVSISLPIAASSNSYSTQFTLERLSD